jgi:aminopeptidase YwaD
MNRLFRFFSLSVSLSVSFNLYSQNHGEVYQYARQIVDTLASPSMHGRGYVKDGDKIAANYMEGQFQSWGLKSFTPHYRQEFHLNVNTFPGEGGKIGYRGTDQYFEEGQTVLTGCNSPPTPYTLSKIAWFDSATLHSPKNLKRFYKTDFHDKVLVIDPKGITAKEDLKRMEGMKENPVHAHAVVFFNNKRLMWDVAQDTASFPSFELLIKDSDHDQLKNQFKEAGHFYYAVESKLISNYPTQNLVGYIPGSVYPDSFLVFSAHYDHLGHLGQEVYFPGANDNASGCAMLLNLAKYFSMPEHKPACSIAFIAFGAEEAGLVGSKYFTEHPLFPLTRIKFLVNLDIMGTGDEGVTVVNGSIYPEAFKLLTGINDRQHYLSQVKIRGKAANSDHYYFSEKGVPALFIYTMGGIKAYHDIYDKAQTLPLTKFEDVFHLLVDFEGLLEKPH